MDDKKQHGGRRPGSGRKPGPPRRLIRIAATDEEYELIIRASTPRERTEILLKAAR